MAIRYLILLSRQGKVRLAKWFTTLSPKDKAKIIKDVSQLVLARRTRMCNFLEYKETKVVYRRYASLFFIAATDPSDNDLITLEIVHRYVEQMDKYYGNVCELDIIFNFQKAYFILDELLLAGELQESSKKNVLRVIGAQDSLEDMEYLPLRDFDSVTNALNFSTPDCHVIGGCDLYTTKAAGGDKKLYRNIEHSLESQYESLVRLSASLSPPYRSASSDSGADPGKDATSSSGPRKRKSSRRVDTPEIDLSRASPFGPLSQITARRTFAYLIATLNASHPDYDFSHLLRASDFHKERSLRSIMTTVDSTLQNLRPKPSLLYLAPPVLSRSAPVVANSMGSEVWSPRMWTLIDAEMGLRQCEKYSFVPEEDPFDGEDGGASVWSMHFFFFNKERKRVCYLHLRGLSVISHSPVHAPMSLGVRRREGKGGSVSVGEGAGKRASYWLGSLVGVDEIDTSGYGEDDDDEEGMVGMAGRYDVEDGEDDEVEEVPDMSLDDIRSELAEGNHGYDAEDDDMEDAWLPQGVRGVSEEIGEVMDM
ncbi:RNA polymerase III-inhibiting protein maf1 [Friedmanniomyces endolithicus]|nr:RNA polymerase III-inhibiting protein maf1 [Friedmanniomyces endolithicus]KAK0876394.1 RNA polymerase III-inhibiting protein maf1 [Friedmanniomyces endolithicus]KAK0929455.1 RNA polymerase III-inhibiting protein maf1 [Friedmanniomyces endolithicus]KAK1032918.1 RNA polymerase III-inhibiting protein maf1 [Friedmanniomyces endolithicus]